MASPRARSVAMEVSIVLESLFIFSASTAFSVACIAFSNAAPLMSLGFSDVHHFLENSGLALAFMRDPLFRAHVHSKYLCCSRIYLIAIRYLNIPFSTSAQEPALS